MIFMRNALLQLSRSDGFRRFLMGFGLSRRVAHRFVAGDKMEDALAAVKALNRRGLFTTLDHLGENVTSRGEAARATEDYCHILGEIAEHDLQSTISIKLTHVGLDAGKEFGLGNAAQIVETAQAYGNLVEIDMEGSSYTDDTLSIYRELRERYGNVRVCLQANLYRTQADLDRLIEGGANVRLCKGAYDEPAHIAYQRKKAVDDSLVRLLKLTFSDRARVRKAYPAVASHDSTMINWARIFAMRQQMSSEAFEFQMLYGIQRGLQQQLADQGLQVRIYVPFGSQWYPYFMRRLAERPANVAFFLRALASG